MSSSIQNFEYASGESDVPKHDSQFHALLDTHNMLAELPVAPVHDRFTAARFYTGRAKVGGVAIDYKIGTYTPLETSEVDIVTPGFGGTETAYAEFARENLESGNSTLNFDPSRDSHDLLHPERLLRDTVVAISDDMCNRYGVKRIGVIGHSMGGPAAFHAAQKINRTEGGPHVEHLTMVDAAGMTDHNIGSLAVRSVILAAEVSLATLLHPGMIPSSIKHNVKNPARTILEMLQTSNDHISPEEIAALRNLGISVTALFHKYDPLFPGDKAKARNDGAVDAFIVAPTGGHLTPIITPWNTARDLVIARNAADVHNAAKASNTAKNLSIVS